MLVAAIIFSVPFYSFFIWGIFEPIKAKSLFYRWRYKETPTYSYGQLMLFKIENVVGIITATVLLISYSISF